MNLHRARRALLAAFVVLVPVVQPILFASSAPAVSPQAAPLGAEWQHLNEPGLAAVTTSFSFDPRNANHLLLGGEMDGVLYSYDNGNTLASATGLRDYEMGEFTWHPSRPNEVWVGSMGGPYVSRDGGRSWSAARVGMPGGQRFCYAAPIEKVLFDPNNANHLIAVGGSQRVWENSCEGTRSAIWESNDGGGSWGRKGDVLAGVIGTAGGFLPGSSQSLFVATHGGGVWASNNGGSSWQQRSFGLPHGFSADLAFHPTDPNTMWVTLGAGPGTQTGGVYKTTDGGANWQPVMNGLTATQNGSPDVRSRYHEIEVSPSNPNILYVSDVGWAVKQLYRTDNGGASWQPVNGNYPARSYAAGNDAYSLAVDPSNPNHVAMGNQEIAFLSNDGGANWISLGERAVAGGWVGRGATLLVANTVRFNPWVAGQLALSAMDGGNLWLTSNSGQSWQRPLASFYNWGGSTDVQFTGPRDAYVVMGQSGNFNAIAYTHDGGASWGFAHGGAYGLPEQFSYFNVLSGALGYSGNAVLATIGGALFRSIDGGARWNRVGIAGDVLDLASDTRNGQILAVTQNAVFVSNDQGASFFVLPGSKGGQRIQVDQISRIYVTDFNGGGVWRGESGAWRRLRNDPASFDVAIDPTDYRRIVAVTHDLPYHDDAAASGVWVSYDDGASWGPRNEGLSMTRVTSAAFDPFVQGRVVISTFGAGFWDVQLGPTPPLSGTTTTTTAPPPPPVPTVPVDPNRRTSLNVTPQMVQALEQAARAQEARR